MSVIEWVMVVAIIMYCPAAMLVVLHASRPRSGDSVQSQAAKPEAYDPDECRWEDDGGNSGLRAAH